MARLIHTRLQPTRSILDFGGVASSATAAGPATPEILLPMFLYWVLALLRFAMRSEKSFTHRQVRPYALNETKSTKIVLR